MNTSALKSYAPAARDDFIAAVTARAAAVGLSADGFKDMVDEGDVVQIGGKAFPKKVLRQRKQLEGLIKQADSDGNGFEQVMESMAYTWFNRFMAIRFMEVNGYLGHGRRVLGHPEGSKTPEILQKAAEIELPGLDREKVLELKLDGTKDKELYKMLLLAQCRALSEVMPFLFENIDDATELLLPDKLLNTDSLIRRLVDEVPVGDWHEVEIIGWLYQFYISDKKDEVIGKVVKSEDIPAATQLFTPNWIVKYLVENSLGAQWLATYPDSGLKDRMEYYIEPAEQTEAVQGQLKAITPDSLDPEKITLMDPACGSGHILVEAYEVFKAIYLERGYTQENAARLILEKNLFGLDIDERARQLTGFALLMKARADDDQLLSGDVKLNVAALRDSTGFNPDALEQGLKLADYDVTPDNLKALKALFENATTFGSLIQVPEGLAEKLPGLRKLSEVKSDDLFVIGALEELGPLVEQAEMLAAQYDVVVANPPYMGKNGMNSQVKKFAKDDFPDAKSDLFACFIERGFTLAKETGHNAMVTMQSWMFLSSFEKMRVRLLEEKTINTMAHLGARAFGSISGEVVQVTAFAMRNHPPEGYHPVFFRLLDGGEEEKRTALVAGENRYDRTAQGEFKKIPGSPVGYWLSQSVRGCCDSASSLGDKGDFRSGMATGDNDRFLRYWYEVGRQNIGIAYGSREEASQSGKKWFPYCKGGAYRKWYGNNEYLVNFGRDGFEIKQTKKDNLEKGLITANNSKCWNQDKYFAPSVTWTSLSVGTFGARLNEAGYIFDTKGQCVFTEEPSDLLSVLGCLNSKVTSVFLQALSPTLDFNSGSLAKIPLPEDYIELKDEVVALAKNDWDAYERSWDFQSLPLLTASPDSSPTLEASYTAWIEANSDTIAEMKRLEEENNSLFIDAYGLQDELTPEVPIEEITLTANPAYRYRGKFNEEERQTRFREDTMEELVSYAIGCMMGRYSLDEPGLVYAQSGGEGFDPGTYKTFKADEDGIIPLTDFEWFDDDAMLRFEEFLKKAWPEEHIDANLRFVAESLGGKEGSNSQEVIRKYLCRKFFKSHLQGYKKRPIYWLFSSGKERAFQCLVYLHRYNEGTLARMRIQYLVPLQGKINQRLEQLASEIDSASSASRRRKLEKESATLHKQLDELREFDELLNHAANEQIAIDLDDGVKVNYGKFGTLLSDVKAVTGKKPT